MCASIRSKAKAKAAWSYINQPGNAKQYSAAQLKRIKGRIRAALIKFGVKVAAEGWSADPAILVTEAIAEDWPQLDGFRAHMLAKDAVGDAVGEGG